MPEPMTFPTTIAVATRRTVATRTRVPSSIVTVSPELFVREHGIGAVLPFIAHSLSGASVVPVVMSVQQPWQASSGCSQALSRATSSMTRRLGAPGRRRASAPRARAR